MSAAKNHIPLRDRKSRTSLHGSELVQLLIGMTLIGGLAIAVALTAFPVSVGKHCRFQDDKATMHAGHSDNLLPPVTANLLPIRIRSSSLARRKGARTKADIERERKEKWERTCREVDELYAAYAEKISRDGAKAVGVVYARYSTRFQDSIADQVRTILEHALAQGIYVPRDLIFFDLAVRGYKRQRNGLEQAERALRQRKATVLLLFSTSRLFRKQYRTLAFVDVIHRGLDIRCIFVKSGVDTNDKQRWETILATQTMIDQFVVSMNIANVQAAQEGLLSKQLVFGTLTFGYTGEVVEGSFTKLGRPRRRIIIDPVTAEIVRQVYEWYVHGGLSINEIVERLNIDETIPLPPGTTGGQWTRRAVARMLRNTRFRGLWKYGVVETIYNPDKDYNQPRRRAEALKEIQLDELRIVDDELWYAAQVRLAKRSSQAGRPPKDGDRKARPKVLNDFYSCPKHGRLHVSGSYGKYMHCPVCHGLPWEARELVSDLNREVAHHATFEKLAELVRGDEQLAAQALAACDLEVEAAQRPDPNQLVQLRTQSDKIKREIEFTRRTIGETQEEQDEAAEHIKTRQRERAAITAEIERLQAALARTPKKPTEAEAQHLVEHLGQILIEAAKGEAADVAAVREVAELLTGGGIMLEQMGEREPQRGWLQGRICVRLLPYLVEQLTGVPATCTDDSVDIVVDYKRPLTIDELADRAWELAETLKYFEIALELRCSKTYVTKLIKHACKKRGVPYEDGRARRARVKAEQPTNTLSTRVAERVMELYHADWLYQDIVKECKVSWETVQKIVVAWHTERGLPVPDGRTRLNEIRRRKAQQAKQQGDAPETGNAA